MGLFFYAGEGLSFSSCQMVFHLQKPGENQERLMQQAASMTEEKVKQMVAWMRSRHRGNSKKRGRRHHRHWKRAFEKRQLGE